jgi:hypothetical protein
MKKLFIISLLLTGCATWTPADKALLIASWTAAGADYYTTSRAIDRGYNELNPAMGSNPSDTELLTAIIVSQTAITILAHTFPKWRKWLLGGSAVIHAGCAVHNERLD